MAITFRILLVLGLACVLFAGAAGGVAAQDAVQATAADQTAQIARLEQRVSTMQAGLERLASTQVLQAGQASALTGRVAQVELGLRSLQPIFPPLSSPVDLSAQIDGLDARLSGVETTLGPARNRYCRLGIVDCINSLELRFGP